MKFTESVRSFHVPATPFTSAWPPRLPSVPTSRATRVTSAANEESWSTIVLTVFFSSRISPLTSTVILRDRSPRATAVVTSAMLRTCDVRFDAMKFTESVRSFHVPDTPSTRAWPPSIPSVPTSRATRVTSEPNERSWSTIVLMVFFSSRNSPFTSTVIFLDRSPFATAVVTSAILRTCAVRLTAIEFTLSVKSFHVPATPLHFRLAAELAFGADLARHARHFGCERAQLIHHLVDRLRGAQKFAFERTVVDFERHGLREVALRHGADHARGFAGRMHEVVDQFVDVIDRLPSRSRARRRATRAAAACPPCRRCGKPHELFRGALVQLDDIVECLGDLACEPGPVARQAHRAVAALERGQRAQQRGHLHLGQFLITT